MKFEPMKYFGFPDPGTRLFRYPVVQPLKSRLAKDLVCQTPIIIFFVYMEHKNILRQIFPLRSMLKDIHVLWQISNMYLTLLG